MQSWSLARRSVFLCGRTRWHQELRNLPFLLRRLGWNLFNRYGNDLVAFRELLRRLPRHLDLPFRFGVRWRSKQNGEVTVTVRPHRKTHPATGAMAPMIISGIFDDNFIGAEAYAETVLKRTGQLVREVNVAYCQQYG